MTEKLVLNSLAGMEGKKFKKKKNKAQKTPGNIITEASVVNSNHKNDTSTLNTTEQCKEKVNMSRSITSVNSNEMSGIGISDQSKQKNKTKKKKKKNNNKGILVERKRGLQQQSKEGEVEDVAESIDSGCIADSPSDNVGELTDWPQVGTVLLDENKFISNLLMWLPIPKEVQLPDVGMAGAKKRMAEDEGENDPNSKRQKAATAYLEDLQDKYMSKLAELRSQRKQRPWDVNIKKKELKMNKKLKNLRQNNNTRKEEKRSMQEQVQPKMKKEKNKNNAKPTKPIYNSQGELVFSKFDFSSNTGDGIDTNMKPKDLKQLLSQALKEKEKAKRLEHKGHKDAAVGLVEQRAWSGALQKAEGTKVRDNVDLLKRSIKKQELRKKSSQKKWEDRKQREEKKKMEKDAARKKNLGTRKEARINKKMNKMKKKGHVVPGF